MLKIICFIYDTIKSTVIPLDIFVEKSLRSKNISLKVPKVTDPPTDYERGKDKHKDLGAPSSTSPNHEELLQKDKDGSKDQQYHDQVQKRKGFLSKIQSETESSIKSHCKGDRKIKETSVDTAGNIFDSQKVHASQYQSSRHFNSLPAENVAASTMVSTSVSPNSKETMLNSIHIDKRDAYKKETAQVSEFVHSENTYSSLPLDMSTYSSKSVNSIKNKSSRRQTIGANSRFDGLTSTGNAIDDGLPDRTSEGKAACCENGEACRNDKRLSRSETDEKSYITEDQCLEEFIGTPESKLEVQKTQSSDMSDDKKASSQAIQALDQLSFNNQALTDTTFCDRKFKPERHTTACSKEPSVDLNETNQPSGYTKDNGIKVFGHGKLFSVKASSIKEENVHANMKTIVPDLLEEDCNVANRNIPTLRYLSYATLKSHGSKLERCKNILGTQADEFDNKNLSLKDIQEYTVLDEASKETRCQFESEISQTKFCKIPESKVSKLKCQTPVLKTHIGISDEEPSSNTFENDMKLKSDSQDSRGSNSSLRTIVKYKTNKSSDDLPKEIIFVAEQDTIHLYQLINQSDDTDSVNRNIKENITEENTHLQQEALSNKTETHKKAAQKSQKTNCPVSHHATTCVTMVRPDVFVNSFENDVVSALRNSPEDENNLCDNLLPNQIKYMSLMRQTDGSGKIFTYDIESLQALSPDYLEKMAKAPYKPINNGSEQEHQLEDVNTVYNSSMSDSAYLESSVSRQPENGSSEKELEKLDSKLLSGRGHSKKAFSLKKDTSTEPFKPQLNTSDILTKENGVSSEPDMHTTGLPTQDNTSHIHQRPKFVLTDKESIISHDNTPVHTKETERKAFEKVRDLSFPRKTKPTDDATQHLTDKTRIPEVKHKHNPPPEDMAEKHHQSKGENEKEKAQTMIETMLAAIEAGILLPKKESSAKSSKQSEVEKQLESTKEEDNKKIKTAYESLLATIILALGNKSSAKSPKPKQSSLSFLQQEQIIQWTLTISQVKAELKEALQSNDPKRIISAYTEYGKKCQECSSWISALLESLCPSGRGQVESLDEESFKIRDRLTVVSESLSEEARIAAVTKELFEKLTGTNTSSINTDVDNAVFGEPSASTLTSDTTRRDVFSEMVTALLSVFLSGEKESRPYPKGLHSPASCISHQPLTAIPSYLQEESVKNKKPFTDRLLKNSNHKDSNTGKEFSLPQMKHSVKSNVTKKNKNVLPLKTSKSKADETTFHLDDHSIENSDKYRLYTQEDRSNDSIQSDTSRTDSSSSEWDLSPLFSCTSHGEGTEETVNEQTSMANKISTNREYCKEDFEDLHHAKAHNTKDGQPECGTHTISGMLIFHMQARASRDIEFES